jgi:hypothetical protein
MSYCCALVEEEAGVYEQQIKILGSKGWRKGDASAPKFHES